VPAEAQFTQQAKLVGTGAPGRLRAEQGFSVSLSGDGNTAIIGGPSDNNDAGAAWVYTRSGGVWSQQAKLVGTGAVGAIASQGRSVSLSADGDTAIVGGPGDNNQTAPARQIETALRTGCPACYRKDAGKYDSIGSGGEGQRRCQRAP
jgi:hypothetical protein